MKEFQKEFEIKKEMNFEGFLSLFTLKATPSFMPTDIKNAFRLLSKEYVREN